MISTSGRVAVIDCGTNTFHLLIAEFFDGEYSILHKEKEGVKLGQGGISDGMISKAALDRAIATLGEFNQEISRYAVHKNNVFIVGTSAVRSASNRSVFTQEIREKFGWDVQVLSGKEEANLIYEGVKQAIRLEDKPALIMDVGGGSCEFIIANNNEQFWSGSFEIGGQRLLDLFMNSDPILPHDINTLRVYLDKELSSLEEAVKHYKPAFLIGSSGTFDTLFDLYNNLSIKEVIVVSNTHRELSIDAFYKVFHDMISKSYRERLITKGMIDLRAEMIVVALLLVEYVIDHYQMKKVVISSYALKEGLIKNSISALIAAK